MDRKRGQRIVRDPTERFSDRVDNYVKYRPGYPSGLYDFMYSECCLEVTSVVADIGSGTGISAKPFLERGNPVFGVEPNDKMRLASIDFLGRFDMFAAVGGSAENTGLPAKSVDLALAAQSFHWFCNPDTAEEIRRILRPGGYLCVVWNERDLESDLFHKEYESLIHAYATDYDRVRHDRFSRSDIENAFRQDFAGAFFENAQIVDREGLKGRLSSSSYVPGERSPSYRPMLKNVDLLFDKYEENGRISVSYKTKLFFSKF